MVLTADDITVLRSMQLRFSAASLPEFIPFNTSLGTVTASGSVASAAGLNVIVGVLSGSVAKVYLNGVIGGTTPTLTGTPAVPSYVDLAARVSSGAATFGNDNSLYGAHAWSRALSDAEVLAYSQNPWQLFRPRRTRRYISLGAGGGNASVTLTGAASTAAAGTTSALGSATATVPGSAGASAAGSLSATGSASVTLPGAASTSSPGTISASTSGDASITLAGAASTSAAGQVSATGGAAVQLTGAAAVVAAGNITASTGSNASVTLSGAAALASAGSAGATGAARVTLAGVLAVAWAGSIAVPGLSNGQPRFTRTIGAGVVRRLGQAASTAAVRRRVGGSTP